MSFLERLKTIQNAQPQAHEVVYEPPPPPTPTAEAEKFSDLFEAFLHVDETLYQAGWHRTSDFWKKHLHAFYRSGKRRFVGRVGRRGGKSSTMCRAVATEVVYGKFYIPPGDVGVFTIVSKDRADARDRIVNIEKILNVLGVPFDSTKDEIVLSNAPIKIRTFVATIKSIVGHTSIGILADEVARWRDSDTGANPAKEVLASLRPSMKTQPLAHEFMISSPWGTDDAHYNQVELGDTPAQYVVCAATWEANPIPECSEEACHLDEPDPVIFDREYGAIPMPAGTSDFFDSRVVDAAFTDENVGGNLPEALHVAGMDLGFAKDHSALAIVRIDGETRTLVKLEEISPNKNPLVFSTVIETFASILKEYRCSTVMCDAHYRKAIIEPFLKHGIYVTEAPQKPSIPYINAKRLLSDGRVIIPTNKSLRKQLMAVKSFPRIGGNIQMVLPRTSDGHCDAASAFILALHQDKQPEDLPELPHHPKWSDEEREMYERAIRPKPHRYDDESNYQERDELSDYNGFYDA